MGRLAVTPNTLLLGKYRIESVLGQGGMGVVVRARHLGLDEVVAVKILGEDVSISPETCARFMREAQAAARLRSEHVVRVSDVGMLPEGVPYMVMEILDGRDLSQVVKDGGAIGPRFAAEVVMQACEVLAEAHAVGIIHRDIKPSNIFITSDHAGLPFVKVLDFGIAKATDVSKPITRTHSMLGTPLYMSPEQLRSSKRVDHRTDIWALGVMLYEVLEGRRPFDSESMPDLIMHIAMHPPPPMQKTPPALAAIVLRCLDKDPAKRFQSATELAVALAPYAGDAERAHAHLERIHSLVRSSVSRLGERADATPVPPPQGRFDATVEAAARAPAPFEPPPSEPGIPTVPARRPITPDAGVPTVPARPAGARVASEPAAAVPLGSASVQRSRTRRVAIIAATAILAAAIGAVVFASQAHDDSPPTSPPVAPPVAHDPPETAPVNTPATVPADAAAAVAIPEADAGVPAAAAGSGSASPIRHAPIHHHTIEIKTKTEPKPDAAGSAAGSASKPCNAYKDRFGC
jgi:serine/threonine-protein kinase